MSLVSHTSGASQAKRCFAAVGPRKTLQGDTAMLCATLTDRFNATASCCEKTYIPAATALDLSLRCKGQFNALTVNTQTGDYTVNPFEVELNVMNNGTRPADSVRLENIIFIDDKARGLHEGYLVTPISKFGLILGFTLSGAIKAFLAGVVLTTLGSVIAGIPNPRRMVRAHSKRKRSGVPLWMRAETLGWVRRMSRIASSTRYERSFVASRPSGVWPPMVTFW